VTEPVGAETSSEYLSSEAELPGRKLGSTSIDSIIPL